MPIIGRIRQAIAGHRYRLMSTPALIAHIQSAQRDDVIPPLLNALKERLAHQDGSLRQVDWSSAKMNGALLSSCQLQGARFAKAELRGAYFGYSDLQAAVFAGADLQEANLREAILSGAELDRVNFRGANLARADLQNSSCVAADLRDANLWGADLRGSDLTGARMTNCILRLVIVDDRTVLPDGSAGQPGLDWAKFTRGECSNRH